MDIQWIGCPNTNFSKGRHGYSPIAIVVHIMDGSFRAGESVFGNPQTQKSAHYGISKVGVIHQYVDESDTAFHAGVVVAPTWSLLRRGVNPNYYTIGIEHEGRPDDIWPDVQLAASGALIADIAVRQGIPLDADHVIRHHQIRANKSCPGNWITIDMLLQRAAPRLEIRRAGVATVQVRSNVNLRAGAPSTSASIVRVIPAGAQVAVSGPVQGEPVQGNACWYADLEGHFLWAGATDAPRPAGGLAAAPGGGAG
jgi:hypothetical protein